MNLFEIKGVILIAVDDKFTLADKDGHEVEKGSIHRQFLNHYYTDVSGHKDEIAKIIAEKGEATEVDIKIGDKTFVLFAYSSQGRREDYSDKLSYRRGFIEIEGSLEKVLNYCKEHFPDQVVHTALIGTGVQKNRIKGLFNPHNDVEEKINNLANRIGVEIVIIKNCTT